MNSSSRTTALIAKHFRGVFFGGNWTESNLKDQLADVTWEQALTQVKDLNTIATLTYHTGYFVTAQLEVLRGGELNASDKLSFDHPPIASEADWKAMVQSILDEAQEQADLIEQLPDSILREVFADANYGSYYANLQGIIEHTHYHLGQIALVKKMIRSDSTLP